ncbi:phenylacetate--CoA ligase family protein [Microbulbifer hydrolyticus]|uniref:Phenylacetate--CoA ligase family protein n=1 Tax=Microbulbifer hydrolyticus TaxID=48074 RepID=A0A6P1TC20_9GAMM|nr:phenylacetate--CoA ligase [Microbulbifer hydrolyticus]MBB5210131.1 phenylacetate-CoA ligase [Microbulbifer hydrolyticus]QHQ39351.1 phenylacetate--CoA ligase family protein [Microbulbifer hydrolyticus]
MPYPSYFESFDVHQALADYPLGDAFLQTYAGMSRDALRELQNQRFLKLVARGWQIPFYQRLWGEAGILPTDIRSIDDIEKLPVFSKSDIMQSVERFPPIGDFSGLDGLAPEQRPPVVFHTTSGTTGRPQPILFGPRGREIQAMLVARAYRFMGLKPGATVQSTYGHGMINGGHYIREAVTRYTNALFLSAGTGLETRSAQQVQLMRDFGVNVMVGFADYIKKLASVAQEMGMTPGEDLRIDMIIGHLGQETRAALSDAWGGAKLYDWYGVADTGCIAAEGPDQNGLYVWEDAHYLELLDVESGRAVSAGDTGNMVVTCLYKDDIYPVIRFNTCDITAEIPGENPFNLPFRRIRGFLGRSDNMVKLRGINVYPHGIGGMLAELESFTGEYVCIAERDASGRETLTVLVEVGAALEQHPAIARQCAEMLKHKLGIEVGVEPVAAGGTAQWTEIDRRQKPLRLIDRRFD